MTPSDAGHGETRVGIYGGTFNPIHLGHLKAAREVARVLGLDRVIFVPSAQPPHKACLARDPIAPAAERLRWVELAIADEPLFEASDLELARDGASYSIDSLRSLVPQLAPARLVFIVGHDAFALMGSWREPEAILAMVDIAVVSRPPTAPQRLDECLPQFARELVEIAADGRSALSREADTRIDLLAIDALDVSASQIRSDLANAEPIAERVPVAALEAIVASGHYTGARTGARTAARAPAPPQAEKEQRGSQVEVISEQQREKLEAIVEAALERGAREPVLLDVRELTSYADCLVVVSAGSNRQVRAIVDQVVKTLKARGDQPLGVEGGDEAIWMLIDANDVIIHVFVTDTRELFDIEGLWMDAPRICLDLPGLAIPEASMLVPPRTA